MRARRVQATLVELRAQAEDEGDFRENSDGEQSGPQRSPRVATKKLAQKQPCADSTYAVRDGNQREIWERHFNFSACDRVSHLTPNIVLRTSSGRFRKAKRLRVGEFSVWQTIKTRHQPCRTRRRTRKIGPPAMSQ